ncbi:phosphoglucomutase [Desulfosporosinus sp. Sb-LF]|uniref:phosphoglucomutase n=1 Tax=Desulfosporosinus sp. Sb-LF TaxID=2560027 RepID=UPI00107EF7E3|nr:phosphoglucomutase [Desulfosporosinus sp. Sb-LF]TGE33316.1 phosphoglucomutase [Desulfosporosinus sp. Sb-LF]
MYPEEVDSFTEKLNKKQTGVYSVEENLTITAGVFEGELAHDNINNASLLVYTGSKLTGERVMTYTLSNPADAPWRRIITVYSDQASVYVTYETPGDIVEADDVNDLQTSVKNTQTELERVKTADIDGGSFV